MGRGGRESGLKSNPPRNDSDAFFSQASPQYPLFWTENEGWYHPWGSAPIDGGAGLRAMGAPQTATSIAENPNRAPADVAAAVAGWVARGGSFMNYYMYFGGQHFGPCQHHSPSYCDL